MKNIVFFIVVYSILQIAYPLWSQKQITQTLVEDYYKDSLRKIVLFYDSIANKRYVENNYDDAIFYGTEALNSQLKIAGEADTTCSVFYCELGTYYYENRNPDKALYFYEKSVSIDSVYTDMLYNCASTYLNMSMVYIMPSVSNLERGLYYAKKAYSILKNDTLNYLDELARAELQLSVIYYYFFEYDKAKWYSQQSVAHYHNLGAEEKVRLTDALNMLSRCNSALYCFEENTSILQELVDTSFELYGKGSIEYAHSLALKADNSYSLYNDNEAKWYIDLSIENCNNIKSQFEKELYAAILCIKAYIWCEENDTIAIHCWEEAIDIINGDEEFPFISDHAYIYGLLAAAYSRLDDYEKVAQYSKINYNFWKNELLLLNDRISRINFWYSNQHCFLFANRHCLNSDIKELIETAYNEELLTKNISGSGPSLFVDWETIRNSLGNNEIAIEFSMISRDSLQTHLAFILRHDWDCPKKLVIGNEKEMSFFIGKQPNILYLDTCATSFFWDNILNISEAKEGDYIYFAPSGRINEIAIENLVYKKGVISDYYNIKRISSTKQLVDKDENNIIFQEIALYGGLNYYQDTIVHSLQDSSSFRSKYGHLPWTQSEIDSIRLLCLQYGMPEQNIHIYNNNIGTKQTFIQLAETNTNIIHLATHSFYKSVLDNAKMRNWFQRSISENTNLVDYSLENTGILFSNAITEKDSLIHDGYISAKELREMDLSNVDMVVLSSCSSGKGDLSSDGLLGIQRGLKSSGVKTIVMSLWPVDDAATSVLMRSFYKELLIHKNANIALKKAQNYCKLFFDNPIYWASFIVLD